MGVNKSHQSPFQIRTDYSWPEVGSLFKLISDYEIGCVIETCTNEGDFAAWMISVCMFNPSFRYHGMIGSGNLVNQSVLSSAEKFHGVKFHLGVPHSPAILSMFQKRIEKSPSPVMVFCNDASPEKDFCAYLNILRPGDLLCVFGFPVKFSLGNFSKMETAGKLERITLPTNTRLIAGVVC